MKLITRNTDYAMRALCYIAQQTKDSVPVTEMVKDLAIPRPFLRKILQTLSGEGMLDSYRGQGGGFSLSLSPSKIFITDLIKIFQNAIQLNECIFKKKMCPNRKTCLMKREMDSIEKDVLLRLSRISIASLISNGNGKRSNRERKEGRYGEA
ncbi:MAG TPA: Rrf2 family transcriptional regulator [Candidatus Omnitrophota bacterium]|nr:Rrf2 family transcriptional regulator [Candidatus Omnitrophota bacterium]